MDIWLNGLGSYLPARMLDNDSFCTMARLDATRVPGRIAHRFLAPPNAGGLEMAVVAAQEAISQAPMLGDGIGLIAVASAFPGRDSYHCGSPALGLARRLGRATARILDLSTPILGFHDAISAALAALQNENIQAALVVGTEGFSQATQLKDRRISHVLSDGAGAMLLSRQPGFARIGPVRFGAHQIADGANLIADMITVDAGAMLRAALTRAGEPAFLLTQIVGELAGETSDGVLYNPFAEAGHLLNASIPLTLHEWLVTKRPDPDTAGLLFSAMGDRWATCGVKVARRPRLAALDAPAREHVPHGSELVLLALDRLPGRVLDLAASAVRYASRLTFVGLRISGPEKFDDRLRGCVYAEISAILQRQLRVTDRLFKIDGRSVYALFLRGIDQEDAGRLRNRLTGALQHLDLAGELDITVESIVIELAEQEHQGFADSVCHWCSP